MVLKNGNMHGCAFSTLCDLRAVSTGVRRMVMRREVCGWWWSRFVPQMQSVLQRMETEKKKQTKIPRCFFEVLGNVDPLMLFV